MLNLRPTRQLDAHTAHVRRVPHESTTWNPHGVVNSNPAPANQSAQVAIRDAAPQDADQISSLYRAAYASRHSTDAREHYPFPQFMSAGRVKQLAASTTMCWVIAESASEIVGAIGAVYNCGKPDDRVAEYFGLVVNDAWRGNGVARNLFAALHDKLTARAHFTIAETRTADPGGWRTAKTQGFVPLGFEPFAHHTPAGSEPMLLLGSIPEQNKNQRVTSGYSSAAVCALAKSVLRPLHVEPLLALDQPPHPLIPEPDNKLLSRLTPTHPSLKISGLGLANADSRFHVAASDIDGTRLEQEWHHISPHLSGVVGLNRLEGEDPAGNRYTKQYFVGYIGKSPVSCARIIWDHRDRRVRILYLQTRFHGLQGLMMVAIMRFLTAQSPTAPFSVVIDVRADDPVLHSTLEKIDFFPTVYYPGLVASEDGRADAVQYTRLYNCPFEASLKFVRNLDWPEAAIIVKTVASIEKERHSMDRRNRRIVA